MNKRKQRALLILLALAAGLWWFLFPAHLFTNLSSYVIQDKDGHLLGATIASDGQWRFPDRTAVPEKFEKCILAYEDRRFYYHPGIDPIAIGRALVNNIRKDKAIQGASTIAMQVMRLSHGNRRRTYLQKITEALQAIRLECTFSRKRILGLYASHAPFGGNIIGLDAASWRYFGRDADDLSWGETAALAILPNSPAMVYPGKNKDELLRKRNGLLKKLNKTGVIDDETFMLSCKEPLPGQPLPLPQLAPHLLQRFRTAPDKENRSIGKTTIDLRLQREVDEIVNRHHEMLKGNEVRNLCALVLDVETGHVLAYVGNITSDRAEDQAYVDIIKSPRSPGSTLKPLLYAAAMSDGQILPEMLLPDIPTRIGGYTPQNFDRNYDGAVPASQALSRSLNIPAVRVLQKYRYERFYDLLKQTGFSTLSEPAGHYGLSMILGGGEVTLWDLTGVYADMARVLNHAPKNGGKAMKRDFFPPSYLKKEMPENQQSDSEVMNSLDATSIWFAFQSMEDLIRPEDEGQWRQFASSKQVAWKTGTSFGFRDAWAIGASTKYAVGVWVGNADGEGRPGLLGIQMAAPVMFDIFRQLPAAGEFPAPQSNFSFLPICRQSGFRAGLDCVDVDTLMVPANGDRTPTCPYHQTLHLDTSGQYRVTGDCISVSQMTTVHRFILPPTMEWYYRQIHHDYEPLPPFLNGCEENRIQKMDIVYPTAGSKIYVPLELDGQRGKMICVVAARDEHSEIFWHLDDQYLGTTSGFHRMAINPSPGRHTLTVVDGSGETVSRNFVVLDAPKK